MDKVDSRIMINLSGFGPFGTVTQNPTMFLIESLTEQEKAVHNIQICKVVETSTVGADLYIQSICEQKKENQRYVNVHLGVYSGSKTIQIENHGYNLKHFSIPDVRGYQSLNEQIETSLPKDQSLSSQLDLVTILTKLKEKGFKKTVLSDDPGRYICNYIYFVSLFNQIQVNDCTSLFVHVPEFDQISQVDQKKFVLALIEIIHELYDNAGQFKDKQIKQ